MCTDSATLVDMDSDPVWGTGYTPVKDELQRGSTWDGANMVGQQLIKLREELVA